VSPRTKFAGKFLLGALLIALLLWKVDWSALKGVLAATDGRLLALGVAITWINVPIGTARWYVLLKASATEEVRFLEAVRLVLVASFFNVVIPGGVAGDVVRGLETKKTIAVGDHAFSSVITDRLMALVGLLAVAGLGLVFCWRTVLASGLLPYAGAATLLVLVLVAALYSKRLGRPLARAAHAVGRTSGRIARLQESLRWYRGRPATLALAFAITIASHVLMIVSIYALALSLGSTVPFAYFLMFVPIVNVLAALPITLGGLGVRDAGFVLLFPLVGMTRAQALGTSFLFFGVAMSVALLGGLVYLLPAPRRSV
jgi:uncharacterized protein (TIRG00374 family)